MTEAAVYKYKDVLPVHGHQSTVWLAKFETGAQHLHVWHKDAKIEDVVNAIKLEHPQAKFAVGAIDVGVFDLYLTHHSLSNARLVNQDMEIVLDIQEV